MTKDVFSTDHSEAHRSDRRVIIESRLFFRTWYLEQNPDVAASGVDPVSHYLLYGAAMGRDPSKYFSTSYYLEQHPEVAERGLNPLFHWATEGRELGYDTLPPKGAVAVETRIRRLRAKLNSLGFVDEPLAELTEMARSSEVETTRASAAYELALYQMRRRSADGGRRALVHLEAARRDDPNARVRAKLLTAELLCHYMIGDPEGGRIAYDRAGLAGEVTTNAVLARSNLEATPEGRLLWINQALLYHGLTSLRLEGDPNLSSYDRLAPACEVTRVDGPKVTVLIAAYKAAQTIPTALRSLGQQTWANLEIIVIDDASPDDGATIKAVERAAKNDPRIRLIRLERNGGAYVARNRGLDEATGEFVTIHDADDWSHPSKIETQVRYLQDHPEVMGCTSEQARVLESLDFVRVRRSGTFVIFNTSSFLWRREPVRTALGYWDTVRFGADNELIRRVQKVFGKDSFVKVPTGPLSFQREADTSITADPVMGIGDGSYGVRREYLDAQLHHHERAESLRYGGDPDRRPFPVPAMMIPNRPAGAEVRHFDLVVYGDFRIPDNAVSAFVEELPDLVRTHGRIGLVEVHRYDTDVPVETGACAEIRDMIDGNAVQMLVYGDTVRATEVRHLHRTDTAQTYLPQVDLEAE